MKFFKMIVLVLVSALGLTACGGGGGGAAGPTPPAGPAAPTSVVAAASGNAITVTWADADSTVTKFRIYYDTTSGVSKSSQYIEIADASLRTHNVTSADIATLTAGLPYYFKMTAFVNSNESDLSTISSSTIPVVPDGPVYLIGTPASGQVTLNWASVASATSYNVYSAITPGIDITDNTTYSAVVPVTANGTGLQAYVDGVSSPLLNESPMYYVVTAVVSGVESHPTDEISAVPSSAPTPAAPSGVRGNSQNILGSVDFEISWVPVAGATAYNIYWSKFPDMSGATKLSSVTSTANANNITKIVYPGGTIASVKHHYSLTDPAFSSLSTTDLSSGVYFQVSAQVDPADSTTESTLSPVVVIHAPTFEEFMFTGKTVTYTDDAGGAVSFVTNNDLTPTTVNNVTRNIGTVTFKSSTLTLSVNGTPVTLPSSGSAHWAVEGGLFELFLANGVTVTFNFTAQTLGNEISFVTLDATGMTQRTGILTMQ